MHHYLLNIAGLDISVVLDQGLANRLPPDIYAEFLRPFPGEDDHTAIRLRISTEPFTPPPATTLFKAADAWTLSESGDRYYIQWAGRPGDPHPLWTATVDRAFTRIKVNYPPPDHVPPGIDPEQVIMSLYPMDQLLLMHILVNHHGLILHGAGGTIKTRGVIFAGPSGAGKSTLARLLSTSPGHELFSDDRMAVRQLDGRWQAHGTPWPGEAGIARNRNIDLAAVVFLRQAAQPSLRRLPPDLALTRLLPVGAIPWHGRGWIDKGLAVCDDLIRDIPMYEFGFSLDRDATVAAVADLVAGLGNGLGDG